MEETYRRYPIGIQHFGQLRSLNCVYVDKTEPSAAVREKPAGLHLGGLLPGKEWFKGLAMERLEKEWNAYPVFHVDFSLTKYTGLSDLTGLLHLNLMDWEKIYEKEEGEHTSSERLQGLIRRAYEQTGLPAVVLIDEYDVPLHYRHQQVQPDEHLQRTEQFAEYQHAR